MTVRVGNSMSGSTSVGSIRMATIPDINTARNINAVKTGRLTPISGSFIEKVLSVKF
jgi:hypothetical protein